MAFGPKAEAEIEIEVEIEGISLRRFHQFPSANPIPVGSPSRGRGLVLSHYHVLGTESSGPHPRRKPQVHLMPPVRRTHNPTGKATHCILSRLRLRRCPPRSRPRPQSHHQGLTSSSLKAQSSTRSDAPQPPLTTSGKTALLSHKEISHYEYIR